MTIRNQEERMNLKEERLQILQMIQDGKISAEEGAKLLAALDGSKKAETAANAAATQGRSVRVRITDMRTGKNKVNLNVPMSFINVAIKMGAKFVPELANVDMNEIMDAIRGGTQGKIIDVEDSEDGEKVEIYID
jgi:hypothetical protein